MKTEEERILQKLDTVYPLISDSDLKKYALLFKHELLAALHNQNSCLPMILNPIYKMEASPGFGVAVSIGGTNGYVSSFRISRSKQLKFYNRISFVLPEDTRMNSLFHLIAQNILTATKGRKSKFTIGIGFAYPLKPLLTDRFVDGELLYMSKGRTIEGLVGKRVGQEFHKFLIREYRIDTTVAVANDAISLLLGGDGVELSGVVGTGLNFAYWEKRHMIAPLKLANLTGFSQAEVAINIEAKNFDKIPETNLRDIVDAKSNDPGYSLAEKEAAGAYLFQIFNVGRGKIIGEDFPELSSTDELNDLVTNAFPFDGIAKEKRKLARIFAQRIFNRSAQIVAIEICGILEKIGKTKGIVPIVMEGGIFWKAKNYPSMVNSYINNILPEVIPSFARLFGSSRRGIAILASNYS